MKIRPLLVVLFSLVIGTVYAQNNFKQVNPDNYLYCFRPQNTYWVDW